MPYNSIIINKKKNLLCGHFDYNFSKGRCKKCASIYSLKKRSNHDIAEIGDESIKNLISDLDSVFSTYIRVKYADKNGFINCFTSGLKMKWKDSQCGHFISRSNLSTRWLEENCRPQSEHDNCILYGNIEVFKAKLEQENNGITEWLEEKSKEIYKPSRQELKQMIIEYRFKLSLLIRKFNIK